MALKNKRILQLGLEERRTRSQKLIFISAEGTDTEEIYFTQIANKLINNTIRFLSARDYGGMDIDSLNEKEVQEFERTDPYSVYLRMLDFKERNKAKYNFKKRRRVLVGI